MTNIKTTDLEKALKHASKDDLSDIHSETEDLSFKEVFEKILVQKGLSRGELIKKTLLDRTYAYQILNGQRNASKDKIIQLCLASNCSLEETNRLLTLSQNPKLYARSKRDSLIIFAINNFYSVMQTNELLDKYQQEFFD